MRQGQAGTLESNDAVITVAEAPAGSGIIIDLESSVKAAYGDTIEAVIRDACREAGIEDAEVDVRDKGARLHHPRPHPDGHYPRRPINQPKDHSS